jgi:hypothetical protein
MAGDLVRMHCARIVALTPHGSRSVNILRIRAESPDRRLSQSEVALTKDFYESVMRCARPVADSEVIARA